ncbi:MAG: pentapeptide repeat-containing protein, partial [Myxococcota bacterium]|nr:pentapeptide repeat-containing protein [Myxococcota bacterium]
MSEENDGSLLRAQNAVALCSIVSLALLWKVYDDQQQQIAQLQQMQDNVAKIERGLKQVESKRLQESAKSRSLQTKNALFAVVPCKRNPGGLCPVTSDPSLRLDMVDRIMKESADKDFQGVNLQGLNLSKINWNGANLTYAQLDYSDFRGADLSNVDFSHASLIGADFTGAKLNNTTLIGADLAGASLENAQLNNTKLQTANLRGVHACGAIFKGVKLSAAWLQGAALWGADLSASNATGYFRGA